MHEPDKIYLSVKKQFVCEHVKGEVRRREDKAGRTLLQRQCVRCGEKIGTFLPIKDFSNEQVATMNFFDETLELKYSEDFSKAMVQQNADEKARLKAEFLQKHDAYLKSEVWKKLRQKILNRSDHICEGCGEAPATQVHHMNYERWGGNELLIDLLAVCRDCHKKLHPKDKGIVDVLIDSRNLPQNNRGEFF